MSCFFKLSRSALVTVGLHRPCTCGSHKFLSTEDEKTLDHYEKYDESLKKTYNLDQSKMGDWPREVKKKMSGHVNPRDRETAESLVSMILKSRTEKEAPILDVRAGPGLLGEEFLRQGVSQVTALETKPFFFPFLEEAEAAYGEGRFQFFNWHIMNSYHRKFRSELCARDYSRDERLVVDRLLDSSLDYGGRYSLVSLGSPTRDSHDFLYFILNFLHTEDDMMLSNKGVDFFFLLAPRLKVALSPPSEQPGSARVNYYSVMIQALFDLEIIGQIPANSFVPRFNSTKFKRRKGLELDVRYLAKMKLKDNIEEILPLRLHSQFIVFLKQFLRKTAGRAVPVIELLVPGSGLRVIGDGFQLMERISDVAPDRMVQLFQSMLTWPEYVGSTLEKHIISSITGGLDHFVDNDESLDDEDEANYDEIDKDITKNLLSEEVEEGKRQRKSSTVARVNS